jgi:flagellar hook-associated protein 3 FlgL
MSMRVSTAQIYSGGTSGIQRLQSDLYTLQNQVDTGRRIVTPKDDPVGSAQALVVTQSRSVNALYIKNQETADTKLSSLDATLGGVNDELQNIYDKAIAAGNGSYSDADRAAVAAELQSRLGNLVGLANSQDGTGRYVFSGFQSTTKPFATSGNTTPYSLTNPSVSYSGDDGTQTLQVGASSFVETNAAGSDVFMRIKDANGNVTGRSVFDAVQNLVDFLKTPGASASSTTYTQSLSDINAAMDNVSRVRTKVGANLSSLDSLANVSADRKLQYDQQLSNLEDLDYAKALTDVSQKKIQLEAAQATFSTTAKLSLFNYI